MHSKKNDSELVKLIRDVASQLASVKGAVQNQNMSRSDRHKNEVRSLIIISV